MKTIRRFILTSLFTIILLACSTTISFARENIYPFIRTVDKQYFCLTIDDGWGRNTVLTMFDTLRKYKVKCTLFIIGNRLAAMPDVWQQAVKDGHEICYHSMNHENVLHMTPKEILEDIDKWEAAAHKALGDDYEIPLLARLPGGSGTRDPKIQDIYAGRGYKLVLWSLDTLLYRNNIASYVKHHSFAGAVLLTHFNPYDKKALPQYIDWLNKNFRLCKMSDALGLKPTLTAASYSCTSIQIKWNTVLGSNGYEVLRSDKPTGNYIQAGSDTDKTVYVDEGLINGKTYYYKIRPFFKTNGLKVYGLTSVSQGAKADWPALNLTAASNTYTSIRLNWNTVKDANGFELYRSDKTDGNYKLIAGNTGKNSYIDKNLKTGVPYYYKVRPFIDRDGKRLYGPYCKCVAVKPSWPAINLKALSLSCNSISLSWNKAAGASGYELYRCDEENKTYIQLAGSLTNTAYTDTGLLTGKKYNYKVRAYEIVKGTRMYSPLSDLKQAIPIPAAPMDLKAARVSSRNIRLSWKSSEGANAYEIYRATSVNGKYKKIKTISALDYTDINLRRGKTYYYKVRSCVIKDNVIISGTFSAVVQIKI